MCRQWAAAIIVCLILSSWAFAQQDLVTQIVVHGNRRIPQETIKARLFTREGDPYDPAGLERDFNSLWNTGYFDDLRIEREESAKGEIVHIYVTEKPTIRDIDYVGLNSVSRSDVLDRFKEQKVGLTQESQYDPTRIKHAEVVLKGLLAEHGRQFATITTEVKKIPPASVGVTFTVKEGPKVKVGDIKFEGNNNLTSRYLRSAMKNLKPYGIPHSIFLENLISKTYDATKLNEDTERVRDAYQQKGYFKALVADPKTEMQDTSGGFLFFKKAGKKVNITLPIEEGDKFHLGSITFSGNKAVTNTKALRSLFSMKDGDTFDTSMVRKGLENMRQAYGELGYINFTPVPDTRIDDEKKLINLNIDVDEGKPFYVRRIEFSGNTTTRDKVIRRELAVEEGQVYNQRLWKLSMLRLNQLQYFETLDPEKDSEVHQNPQEGTVDITLKVREKGKNSIGLNGGVSGLAGAFIGLNYSTNNFLGRGETLSLNASIGAQQRNLQFGFTQPYLFDRPIQFGFTVFNSKYNYDQAKQAEILSNQQLNLPQNVLNTLQNYTTNTTGFTVSSSYALRRSFKRVGLTYSFDVSTTKAFSQASQNLFELLNFRNVSGPNALEGVVTSKVLPNLSFSTIDNPQRPHGGKSLYLGGEISGLGGNVAAIRPIVEFKQFRPMHHGRNVLGYRLQGSFITGYQGKVAPPFERFYLGGDTDLRGFDIRTVSPVAFLATSVSVALTNPDGTPVLVDPTNPRRGTVTIPVPAFQIVFPGGDTSMVGNVEYRIPIVGPVTFAFFTDVGVNPAIRESQLQLSDSAFTTLNSTVFGCPTLNASFACSGGTTATFNRNLQVESSTNWHPRMSNGVELQVIMPIVNAPFRIYWAYNPLRLNTKVAGPTAITRAMFPAGAAGDFTYRQALTLFAPSYHLHEPASTFRFTVSTQF